MTGRASPAPAALLACLAIAAGCGAPEADAPGEERTDVPAEGVYGRVPASVAGAPAVVTLIPRGPVEVEWPASPVIDQLGLQFAPRRLMVQVGSEVQFRNSESLAHNVHIRSVESESTLLSADTPPGESLTFVFETEGGYHILCETHPGMSAFVFATAAAYGAIADEEASFHIVDVAPGEYTLHLWSADPAQRAERTIVVQAGRATEVELTPLG